MDYFSQDVVFFDLETTGLSPACHFIIEVGAVRIRKNGQRQEYKALVKPPISIPRSSEKIHGISNEMVSKASDIGDILPSFFQFIAGACLVAHNAMFDLGFLIKESRRLSIEFPHFKIFDSLKFSRSLFPLLSERPDNFKLKTLSDFINFQYQAHRALDDALATVEVWEYLLNQSVEKEKIQLAQRKSLVFTTDKIKDYEENTEVFQKIRSLIGANRKAFIVYKGGSRKGKERPINPIALIPLPQHVTLYAYCFLDEMYKAFTLKKIDFVREMKKKEEESYGA